MPDPILDLVLKRKAAKERISMRGVQAPAPGFVPVMADNDINDQFQIDQIDTEIKGMGLDPMKIEDKIGDLPSYIPNHIVTDILNIEDPIEFKRKKAATKWQGTLYNRINNIPDPAEKEKGIESFNFLIKGYTGSGKPNYESTVNGIRAAKDAINASLEGDEKQDAISNLKYDAEFGLAQTLLQDPEAQNRWSDIGLNPLQGLALDIKEIFDPTGVEYKKQVTGKFQDSSAQAEQRVKLAELENEGINILGEEISYLIDKKSTGVNKANDFYTQNQPRLQELKAELEKDKTVTEEQKQSILGFQQEYDDVLMGKEGDVYKSPFTFGQLKDLIDKRIATPLQIREYNSRVEKLNGIAQKYKQGLDQYNQTTGAQNAAAREYNNIVNTMQDNLKDTSDYNNLGAWADYLAKQKNSQAERFPEFSQIQMEQLVEDVAGANLGAGSRFVYNLANATGGEAINGLNKLWNNLTLSGDALREAEMGNAYRSRVEEAMMTYETKDQALKERAVIPVINKQTEDKLTAIDASNATDDEKYQQKYRVVEDAFNNKDITYAANPKFGKLNLTSASILNTASAVTSQLIGQLVQAYATGGMGNVSKTRQLSTLFGTVFAQTFGRTYDQAVREGRANPFEYAVTQSTVEALSELPFNNLAMVEKLMPSVKKFAGNLTEGQWKGLIAGKLPSNLGREIARTAEGLAIEGGLEEGLAGVGSNLADKYLFGGNKELFEDVDTQVLAGVIGFAPMSALGLPLRYRSANMGDKLMMYHAGYKADNIIKAINQQLADGTISQQEATERIEAAKQMKSVIDKMPLYDVNGKPLSDYQKAQYAWNEYTKIKAKDSGNLPAQQQEELKKLETEADQNSSNILNGTEDATPKSTVQQQEGRTESNILQPARVEDGQPEIGQGAGIQGQAEIPQANVGYSDTSGQEVDITEAPTGLTEIAAKVVNDAFQTAKSLATAGIKVRVFQNQEDFERESQKLGQQARGQGVFISDGKNILINLSKINSENDWGIVWHEGAHPVLNIIRNTNPELYNNMAKGFGGLAKQGGVFAQIEGWAAADYGDKTDVSTDEAMTETVSLIADGKIKLADIPTSFRQQVIDFVNQVAEFLGLGQLADTSERVFAQKAAQIANTLRAGADVATVVGEENITRTENPFVGQEKKDTVRDNTPKPRDFKAAEEEVKALIEQQASQPEAVVIEPQRDKDGKLKISVDFDDDGKRVVEVKYKQAPYELKKGALKFVDKDETKAAEILSDQIAVDYRANEARPEIAAGIGWYSKMRQRFQKFFGANIETFGQLLAATSARTGVFDNFKQSVEAFKLYSQGQYNDLMKEYDAFVKDIQGKTDDQLFDQWKSENPNKRPGEFDAREYRVKLVNRFDKVPLKANGKKYNANSKKVLQALYGNWLQQTEGPKTKNFAGNLTGRSFGPTIDVWAARYLRRLIYQGKLDRWRIPPSLEKGVDYSILVSGEMSGDYPFAEKVMQMAADKIGINADDLQAFLWYLEKDVWDKNGWTNKAGAEKASFEQGADTLDTERYQAGVTTFKDADTFDPVKFEQERIALEKEIGSLPGVVASRVTESIGEFYSTTGIYVEPTFDVEFTMEKGADVAPVRERIQQILKDYKQDATLFSKLVDRENPNARPIIEIGLAEPVEKSQIIDDIKAILAEDNVRGFTLAKDSRGRILGVRSQFVPEFEQGVSIEDGVKRFVNAFEKIKSRYGKDRNISYLASGYVDTEVKFQEDGKESQQDGGDSGTVTGMEGQPQQSPAGPLSDQQPESGRDNQGGSGDAGGMGQEPGTGQQRRSAAVTAEIDSIVADAKANGTYLIAPNGQPTKLTPDQWAIVRTNNFKNWFGDWKNDPANASKVVDENGEPLVVYHGGFSNFDTFRPIAYFSDAQIANQFADPVYRYGDSTLYEGEAPNVMPAFLSLKKPKVLTTDEQYEDEVDMGVIDAGKIKDAGFDSLIFDPEAENENYKYFVALSPNQIKSATGNSGEFKTTDSRIQERRSSVDTDVLNTAIQERKSAAKITGKAIDSIKDQVVKLGYGYLPDDVRERLKKKQRQIDADLNDMNVLNKRFETAVRESYGVKYKNLTPEQKADFDLALRNFEGIVSRAEKDKLRDQIPDSVMGIIDEMRFTVDSMSKNLVDLGIMDNSLEPAFDDDKGLGVYLTRTYRKYDDPEWVKNVPELVRTRAKTYLATNNTIKEMDAQGNIVERPLTEEELDGLVNYIASNTDPVMEGLNAANAGKVKVDILKGRKVIPEEIRELMGEYKDPSVNFARSIAKMSTLINTHQALKEIAEANIGTLFFREPQGEYFVPVAGKDATALQPLSGLYSTKEIADAFKEAQATFEGDDWNLLALRALAWINGAAKIGKTALSPASWVRNVIGGHIIMLKDGHIGGTGYADGWKSAFGYFFNKEKDSPEFQAKMREYIENGILGEGVAAGEFQAIVKAAYGSDNPLDYIKKDTKLGRATEFVKGFYSAQDDIFRVWSYENEKARLINRKPNMSEAELQSEASRKARATYPTYSELPEVVRKLAKFIPISSFPAFSAELIRTTKNSVAIALEEMKDPDMRDIGIKRMAGVITAISFGSILSGLSSMIVDVDDEEEKSLRRFLPEWSKNSQLIWLGRDENGLPKYIDLGFSDPFSYFKKPFVAFTSDKDNVADRAKDAVKEATAPFVSPEIFLSAMVKGNKVVNESDDMDEVIGKYAGPIYEALEPGLIASGRRILKGVTGEVDRYGQQYDAGLEATAFFTGQRIKKFDPSVGFAFKAKEFNKRRTETLDAYYMEKSKTVKNEAAMEEELTNAEQKFIDNYSEFKKDYDAAMYLMTLNMTAAQAKKVLDATMKDRGVPEMFRKAIKNNKPYPGIMKKD